MGSLNAAMATRKASHNCGCEDGDATSIPCLPFLSAKSSNSKLDIRIQFEMSVSIGVNSPMVCGFFPFDVAADMPQGLGTWHRLPQLSRHLEDMDRNNKGNMKKKIEHNGGKIAVMHVSTFG